MRNTALMIAIGSFVVVPGLPIQAENTSGESMIKRSVTNRPVKVFIVAGQSNAEGYNNIREYKGGRVEFPEDRRCQPDVLFWNAGKVGRNESNEWSALSTTGAFGPEIGFAYDLASKRPADRIGIIKFAVGSTGIARSSDYSDYIPAHKNFKDHGNNWHPPSEGHAAGLLYQRLLENVRVALGALNEKHIKWELAGCMWMQGEHEAGISLKMAQDYDKLLTSLIRSIRKDLKTPSLPFVIGQVNSHTWAYSEIARDKQALVCQQDRNAVLVKTTDLSRKGSGGAAHFDADGMLELGYRFAKAAISLTGKDKTEHTHGSINGRPHGEPDCRYREAK